MPYVMEMATDADIVGTPLNAGWGAVAGRQNWQSVAAGNGNLPAGATIVVVAHGDGTHIGNHTPGTIDLTAAQVMQHIQANMAAGAPGAVYLSVCAPGIAQFTAALQIAASAGAAWAATRLWGHCDAVVGAVPAPAQPGWTEIFRNRTRSGH